MSELLSDTEIAAALTSLPGWEIEDGELVKTYSFATYMAGIQFVNRLAERAETLGHHPDLLIGWRKVTVQLCTHSANGLTPLDVRLAAEAEDCAASQRS
jgi:4a-hydroxytetrahydrobiopterin dehydratase